MKDNALYALGFVVLIVAVIAFSAPAGPMPGQGFWDALLDKLPSIVATILLTPLVLLFAGVAMRAYKVWERNQRQARRYPQRATTPAPRQPRVSVDQMFKAWLVTQFGGMRQPRRQPQDDPRRLDF